MIRIEVQADERIEIMHTQPNSDTKFLHYQDEESAIIVIRFLLRRDKLIANGERFTPQIIREARREFNKLIKERK